MNIIHDNKIDVALLKKCIARPAIYENSTDKFWDDEYISEQMLGLHLNPDIESASKTKDTIQAEAEFIICASGMNEEKTVLDMGCGPGLYVREFAKTGAAVTGIDLSGRSIGYAREKIKPGYPNAHFLKMNYLDMDFQDSFDVVTMIYYDFCVLSVHDQKALLTKIHRALKKDGLFLFDIVTERMASTAATSISVCEGGFWSPRPYVEILNTFTYENPNTQGQQYAIIEEDGTTRIIRFYNRLFSFVEITELLNGNGFKIRNVYQNLKGEAYEDTSETCGIIAVKA